MSNITTNNQNFEILFEFLNTPLDSGDMIFSRFAALKNAIVCHGNNGLERFVYIPGTRKDRVVLTAHIDTVWDRTYKTPYSNNNTVIFENGIFKSGNGEYGIGADDRAGCAMLWALKDSGHSILITDGEEFGKYGANLLKKHNRKLFNEINRHRYIIAFDWAGTNCCLFNQVDDTKKFKKHIESELGFIDSKAKGGSDLQVLCRNICGVNIGVGYHNCHTKGEILVLSEWENTLNKVTVFLEKSQPKFRSQFFKPYIRSIKIFIYNLLVKIKK